MAFRNDNIGKDQTGQVDETLPIPLYDIRFRANKNKELQDDKEDYTVYIPIKYYKANYTQITGAINGLLSMKNRNNEGRKWFLYNGTIPKNIRMEYAALTKKEQCAYNNRRYVQFSKQVLEKLKIKMPTCIERDGDPAISPTEEVGASMTAIVDNVPKDAWFSCGGEFTGKERLYVLLSHVFGVVCISTFSTYTEYAERGILAWNLVRTDLIKNMYLTMATFFQTNEDTGMIGMSAVLLASLYKITENDIEFKKYILETLSGVLKTTGTALQGKTTPEAILSELLPSPSSTINPNVTAVNTISSLVALSRNLMARLKQFIPYIIEALKPPFQYMYTMFQNFTSTGTFTATANTTTTTSTASSSYILKRLGLKTIQEYLFPVLKIANVGYFMYSLSRDEKAWSIYNKLICFTAQGMRGIINLITGKNLTKIYRLFNKTRRRRYQYQLLEGNKKWELAKKRLLELNAKIEIETQPRMVLEGKAIKKVMYSENPEIVTNQTRIGKTSDTWVPYVYVVATGEAEINNKMQKVWYFYDYNYYLETQKEIKISPVFDLTIWRVPQTITDKDDDKQVLSNNIPTEAGGAYCTYTLNGRTVSGIPLLVYLPCYWLAHNWIIPKLIGLSSLFLTGATINYDNINMAYDRIFEEYNNETLAYYIRAINQAVKYLFTYGYFAVGPIGMWMNNYKEISEVWLLRLLKMKTYPWLNDIKKTFINQVPSNIYVKVQKSVNYINFFIDLLPCLIARLIYNELLTRFTGNRLENQGYYFNV